MESELSYLFSYVFVRRGVEEGGARRLVPRGALEMRARPNYKALGAFWRDKKSSRLDYGGRNLDFNRFGAR